MGSIHPPSPLGMGAEFSPSSDPEAASFLKKLQFYETSGSPAQQLLAQNILNQFNAQYPGADPKNPPAQSHSLIELWLQNLVGSSPCDVYMFVSKESKGAASLSENELDTFVSDMNTIPKQYPPDQWNIQAYGPQPVDTLYANVYAWMAAEPSNPLTPVGQQVLDDLEQQGSGGSTSGVQTYLDSIFTDPNFLKNYPGLQIAVLQSFLNDAYPTPPPFANQFAQMVGFINTLTAGTDDYKFVDVMLSHVQQAWQSGDTGPLNTFWNKEVVNDGFLKDYPLMSGNTILQMEHVFNGVVNTTSDPVAAGVWALLVLVSIGKDPALALIASSIINEFQKIYPFSQDPIYPPPGSGAIMEQIMTGIVSGTPPVACDIYMYASQQSGGKTVLSQNDLTEFLTTMSEMVQQQGGSWSIPPFGPTPVDTMYMNLMSLSASQPSSSMAALISTVLKMEVSLGSGGDVTKVPNYLNSIFTDPNFLKNYPNIVPADLAAFITAAYLTPPPFASQFAQTAAFLQTLAPNTDDYKFVNQIYSMLQKDWSAGNMNDVTAFLTEQLTQLGFMQAGYPNYIHLSESTAILVEQMFTVSPPDLQHQIFQMEGFLLSLPPYSQTVLMASGYMQNILESSKAGLSPQQLGQIWNSTAGASVDIYMQWPTCSDDDIATVAAIMGGTVPPKTQMDIWFQTAYTQTQQLLPGTPEYQLYSDMLNQIPSSDADPATVITWANNLILNYFNNYPGLLQTEANLFMSHFPYKLSLQYLLSLQIKAQDYQSPVKSFYQYFQRIVNGYLQTQPNPTPADFQNYLNANYSTTDFCFMFSGVPPQNVNDLFSIFGVKSPYAYGAIDDVYATIYDYNLFNKFPLNSAEGQMINLLLPQLIVAEGHYDPSNPNADLYKTYVQPWMQAFSMKYPDIWKDLQVQTQTLFNALSNLE